MARELPMLYTPGETVAEVHNRVTANNRNYKASASFMSPQRASKLTDSFNEVWQHSSPDMQTRRIYI